MVALIDGEAFDDATHKRYIDDAEATPLRYAAKAALYCAQIAAGYLAAAMTPWIRFTVQE